MAYIKRTTDEYILQQSKNISALANAQCDLGCIRKQLFFDRLTVFAQNERLTIDMAIGCIKHAAELLEQVQHSVYVDAWNAAFKQYKRHKADDRRIVIQRINQNDTQRH